jgi:hypothetical protein
MASSKLVGDVALISDTFATDMLVLRLFEFCPLATSHAGRLTFPSTSSNQNSARLP